MTGTLRLPIIGDIEAPVIAPTQDGYRVGFAPTAEQRGRIIARLHTASAAPGTNRGSIAPMIRELARALTR